MIIGMCFWGREDLTAGPLARLLELCRTNASVQHGSCNGYPGRASGAMHSGSSYVGLFTRVLTG